MKNIFRKSVEEERSTKKIAFVHHKGGTGKTTSCLNVAGWLAKMNKKVLVIDLDPQGNALFKFRKGDNHRIEMTMTQFAVAWGLLPPDVANEIHDRILEVNLVWTGQGEAS